MSWITNPYRFGSPIPLATHWRLVELGHHPTSAPPSGMAIYIGDLEMMASVGGANLCTGGTATSYGVAWSPGALANVFDVNSATSGDTDGGVFGGNFTTAVGYIFATPVRIGAVRLRAPAASESRMPRGFVLQYSVDSGATWISTEPIGPVANWSASEQREYAIAPLVPKTRTTAKLWRLANIVISGGSTYTGELYWRTTSGGANLADVTTTTLIFGQLSTAATNYYILADANVNSWLNHDDNGWIGFFFATAPNPVYLGIKRWFGAQIDSLDVQWSQDGVTWVTEASFTSMAATDPLELTL